MVGFFLVSLCKCVPVFSVIFYVGVATDKRFALIDSDYFDNFCPLVDHVAFLVSFYHSRLNMIKIIYPILHVHIMFDLNVLGIEHFFVVRHI
jgi:hypothetical protein